MPIFEPKLSPRHLGAKGLDPRLVIARFDLSRMLKAKLGRFFGFMFVGSLLIQIINLYVKHLLKHQKALQGVQELANTVLSQGAQFHAELLTMGGWLSMLLWFQVALLGGVLIARDSLHRIRPLMYAHPLRHTDYLTGKALVAVGLPFCILLPFILFPWLVSLLMAGTGGPVSVFAPLYLIPAAFLIALIMGSVTLGASSMAQSPKAGLAWTLGLLMFSQGVASLLATFTHKTYWLALGPSFLTKAWPEILCGVSQPSLPLFSAILGTLFHLVLWTALAMQRTRPSEAVI